MELLTGEFKITLDDKGRVSLPSRLRGGLPENVLILTKGIEKCLWLFPPDQWKNVSKKLLDSASLSLEKSNLVQHRFIAPAQEIEIDKSGRVAVPQSLRDFAGLTRDCLILGIEKYIEIWDVDRYDAYWKANEEKFKHVLEEMGPVSLFL
ncbi:MAG: division/cell wall cluster transcriptional repressor MraZ [Spirochaetaceae bacterium]|jgi:MraZ protein|nr:division/cell wall cluster transcriptional repressor MraZ [Spirochaetaceae bacterium]